MRALVHMAIAGLVFSCAAADRPCSASELPRFHSGVNTFPWIYRARTLGNDGRNFDYVRLFPYFDVFKSDRFVALSRVGFDFVRAIVEPGPLLAAEPRQREKLVATVLAETHKATDQGLGVIVDPHPRDSSAGWDVLSILKSDELRSRYEAMIVEFARALSRQTEGRYVLELMNEPPGGYGWRDNYGWFEFQAGLVRAVRAVDPALPVLVTGDRGGGIDGLLRLDVSKIDGPSILYSFHYYSPMVVTHQGASWTSSPWRRYLRDVAYPPAAAEERGTEERLRDALSRDDSLSADRRSELLRGAEPALSDYFSDADPVRAINADFARVSDWAKRNHIPASRIILGEFGVFRPYASLETAVHWTHDVRLAAEHNGFAWAYFNYAPHDENGDGFSLLKMNGEHPDEFDASMIKDGLGLRGP